MRSTTKGRRGDAASALSLVLLAVLLAACQGSPSAAVTTLGPAAATSAHDLAAAQRVVLRAVDLPGYRVEPGPEPDATSVQGAASFQQCVGSASAALGAGRPAAQSPGFRKGTSTSVSSLAFIASDEAAARDTMAVLARTDLEPCVTGLLRSVLESDLKLPVVSASSELAPDAGGGDEAVVWRTTVELRSGDHGLTAYSGLAFVRAGRAVGALFDFQTADPFPAAERQRLLGSMVERMRGI